MPTSGFALPWALIRDPDGFKSIRHSFSTVTDLEIAFDDKA